MLRLALRVEVTCPSHLMRRCYPYSAQEDGGVIIISFQQNMVKPQLTLQGLPCNDMHHPFQCGGAILTISKKMGVASRFHSRKYDGASAHWRRTAMQ